jgi:hypothetical protein
MSRLSVVSFPVRVVADQLATVKGGVRVVCPLETGSRGHLTQ